jgi:hypothetical protein
VHWLRLGMNPPDRVVALSVDAVSGVDGPVRLSCRWISQFAVAFRSASEAMGCAWNDDSSSVT